MAAGLLSLDLNLKLLNLERHLRLSQLPVLALAGRVVYVSGSVVSTWAAGGDGGH